MSTTALPAVTVTICTHNPRQDYFAETLAGLAAQEPLPDGRSWELVLIDNASNPPLDTRVDLSWHPQTRIVREERLGLTFARLRCFEEARGPILLFVDDDNVLAPDYVRRAFEAFEVDPSLGAIGGRAIPRYESPPPAWFPGLGMSLACRDLGDAALYADWKGAAPAERRYPECAPIGAGMGIRRNAYAAYIEAAARNPTRTALGRRGADLSSGEDNDIIMTVLHNGWRVAYLPALRLQHLIAARRLTADYLARYAFSSSRTWIQVLDVHGIRPWPAIAPWTLPLRKARAYLRARAWRSDVNRIRWQASCGHFEGRATLEARS